jgi:hypothetical protein
MSKEILVFIPQAFVSALATVEKELPTEMITAIQAVGQAYQAGDIQSLEKLIKIAQKDPDFDKVYKDSYKRLLALDAKNERNKNPHTGDFLGDPGPEKDDNFLAPILSDINPAQKAKETVANSLKQGIISTVQWVSRNIRLS